MPYTPNATDAAEPTIGREVFSAAQEFRTLKADKNAKDVRLAAAEVGIVGLDSRLDTVELLLASIALGTDSTALALNLATPAAGKGSELVWYLPAGTGAVGRKIHDKLRDITISAKDQGIIGDGIADDTTAFGNLMARLGPGIRVSLDGLTIKVSSNTYITSKSGWTLDFEGATIIAANGMAVASGKELLSFRSCTDFIINGAGTVDGNRANRTPAETAAHNMEFRSCKRGIVYNIRSINSCVDGWIANTGTNTDITTYCRDLVFFNCFADNSFRQGMSIINAIDCSVVYGSYDNTNGTAPQAGIDIESNAGAATPGNGRILVHKVKFEGNAGRGVQVSGVSNTREITLSDNTYINNTLGAVDANANSVTIRGGSASGHGTSVVNGIITFSSSTTTKAGLCEGVTFTGNTSTVPCMHSHSTVSGVKFVSNIVLDHAAAGGIVMSGTDCKATANVISNVGGVGINAIGTDPVIEENVITAATSRAILSAGSLRPKIRKNTARDIASVSGAYIQVDDANCIVDDNTCIASTLQATTFGIRITNVTAKSVDRNVCVNLHSTDPYTFTGVGTSLTFVGNVGGTANTGAIAKRQVPPSGTTGTRPAGTTISQFQPYWDTTLGKPIWWDGTNWKDATGTTV